MKYASLFLLALLLVACGAVRVDYDYEKSTNFDNYKTYNYYAELNTGLGDLDTKRLLDAFDAEMQVKGFMLSDSPDFLVNIQSQAYQDTQRSNVGMGVGGGGRNVGGGISIGIPVGKSTYNRQITFHFVDDDKTGLFWEAVSESNYNPKAKPEQREAQMKAIVTKVLSKYPPGGNK